MSSFFRFKTAWQRFFTLGGSSSVSEDHHHAPDITHEIRKISRRPIGYGGYSDIYTGVWRNATGDLKVAIKVIRAVPTTAESNEMPRALRRELSVWKRLRHRNIHVLCGLYEGIGPVPALVSPWCQNGDIKSYLQRQAETPDIELLKQRLLCDVMCGLSFLHSNSIVHGDIKGQNVLISDAGVATLCDFGLSRILAEHSQSVTYTGGRGTSRWMAPEIFLDGERHTCASDMWACGCLLIEVWNNVLPYHTKINDFQLSLAFDAKELPGSQSDIPDSVWAFVRQSCNFDPTQRPTALNISKHFCLQLVLPRVSRWVTLSHPIDAPVKDLLQSIESSLRASASQSVTELYMLTDSELASAIVRHLCFASVIDTQGSGSDPFPQEVFHWCLSKVGIGSLFLPTSKFKLLTADNDYRFSRVIGSQAPAKLQPFARLVEQVRPGLATDFMTQFATAALGRPFNIDPRAWSVAWFPDCNRIAVSCSGRTIRIIDIATGPTLLRFVGHTGCVNDVAVSPNGKLLVSCSDDRSVRLWDAETGVAIGAPMGGHTSWVWSVAFSPDGRHIVSGSSDHTIRIWSTETCMTALDPLLGDTNSVFSVAYSPDGTRIVSGSRDNTVRVWDARTGDPLSTIRGHTDSVQSVAYSPDGLRIVSGSYDRTVRIWDATSGQLVGNPLEGHLNLVLSVAFSPDGTRIASGADDHTIGIWDAATGASIAVIRGHTGWVCSVAFSPDGKRLASCSEDGTVRIWDATDDWKRWDI